MNWLKQILGMQEIHDQITDQNQYLRGLRAEIKSLRSEVYVLNRALGLIVVKIDPAFATPEDDPKRCAESDALGKAVIDKLRGEDYYSNRTRDI